MLATHAASPPPSRADTYQPSPRFDPQALNALEVVGAEIFCVTDYLTALRRRWNRLLPVGRLPSDVLVMIMADLVSQQNEEQSRLQEQQQQQPQSESTRHWAAFSQVCSEWRMVALGASTLWTRLDGRVLGTPMAHELLKRSASMPIELSARGTPAALAQAFLIANGAHRARLRVLEISDLPPDEEANVPTGTHHLVDLPLLEELTLHTTRPPTASHHLLLGRLPRIRRIDLRGAAFSWADPCEPLPALETLSLASIPASAQFDARKLLALLGRAPALRELSLDHAIEQHMTSLPLAPGEAEDAVSLPHLRRIAHAEPALEACAVVLNRLRLSAETQVSYAADGRWNADTGNAFLNTLGDLLLQSPGWHAVELFADSVSSQAKISASPAAIISSTTWPLRLAIPFGIHQGYHPHLRAVLGAHPETVRDLALFHEARIVPSTVHDAILPLRGVRTLRTYFYSLFVLKDALTARASSDPAPSHLPALDTLVIRPLPHESILVNCGIQRDKVDVSDVEILESLLSARRELGAPIRTIHIEHFKRFDRSFYKLVASSSDVAVFVDGHRVGA